MSQSSVNFAYVAWSTWNAPSQRYAWVYALIGIVFSSATEIYTVSELFIVLGATIADFSITYCLKCMRNFPEVLWGEVPSLSRGLSITYLKAIFEKGDKGMLKFYKRHQITKKSNAKEFSNYNILDYACVLSLLTTCLHTGTLATCVLRRKRTPCPDR